MIQLLWRPVWRAIKKPETKLPYDPTIPLLGIHPEETIIEKDTCTPVFIATLFTIARAGEQPRCPSTDMVRIHNVHTMEYDSTITRNTLESVLMR